MKYYTFSQNNSGGSFRTTDKIKEYVIIEAPDAEYANFLAERLEIYFDGVSDGRDCGCCGDRWHRTSESDGDAVPSIYSYPIPIELRKKTKVYSGLVVNVHKDLGLFNKSYIVYPYNTIC